MRALRGAAPSGLAFCKAKKWVNNCFGVGGSEGQKDPTPQPQPQPPNSSNRRVQWAPPSIQPLPQYLTPCVDTILHV